MDGIFSFSNSSKIRLKSLSKLLSWLNKSKRACKELTLTIRELALSFAHFAKIFQELLKSLRSERRREKSCGKCHMSSLFLALLQIIIFPGQTFTVKFLLLFSSRYISLFCSLVFTNYNGYIRLSEPDPQSTRIYGHCNQN